jgi:hypothetical protein
MMHRVIASAEQLLAILISEPMLASLLSEQWLAIQCNVMCNRVSLLLMHSHMKTCGMLLLIAHCRLIVYRTRCSMYELQIASHACVNIVAILVARGLPHILVMLRC